jgi:hypothetical protein
VGLFRLKGMAAAMAAVSAALVESKSLANRAPSFGFNAGPLTVPRDEVRSTLMDAPPVSVGNTSIPAGRGTLRFRFWSEAEGAGAGLFAFFGAAKTLPSRLCVFFNAGFFATDFGP